MCIYSNHKLLPGWEFAHRSFAHSLICSNRSGQMWAIHSGCSGQMSDCEQIAQVAHDKWANVSDLLRSLRTNEQMSKKLSFFKQIAHFLFCSQKMSDSLKKIRKNRFFTFSQFFLKFLKKAKDSLIPSERTWAICSGRSEGMSDRERFAQVAHQKNERMSKSLTFWANRSFAQFFCQKTSDSLQNSMSEFPTLNYSHLDGHM